MGNGIFKTLVAIIFLAAAAFLCGSLAADGITSAIMPILLVVGGFSLLYLGKNCWWVPYVMLPLIINSPQFGSIYLVYNALLLAPVIYWVVMAILGHVKITWHGVVCIDVLAAILVGYMALSWFRHPVYLNIMLNRFTALDSVSVGGSDYIVCFFAVLAYVAVSIIPVRFEQLKNALKLFTGISLLVGFVFMLKALLSPEDATVIEPQNGEGEELRNFSFLKFSIPLMTILLCKYSVVSILCSPWKLALAAISGFGIFISGFRSYIMGALWEMLLTQWLHRRLMSAVLLGVTFVGGVVFLSQQHALDFLPYGVKRALSPLPGIEFENSHALKAAQASSEWRFLMWKWALDPSKGYIKDYTWGDGFGHRLDELRRERYSLLRYSVGLNDQKRFAKHGQWHNGPITAIHRLGIVGLCIIVLWTIVISAYALRVLRALDSVVGKEYVYFAIIPIMTEFLMFYASAGTVAGIFATLCSVAILKVCYCHLRKMGLIEPLFEKNNYVPLMIKELDNGVVAGKS